jgi:hypothetical protein
MVVKDPQTKDSRKVKSGQAAAKVRWGEHGRIVRIDSLTLEQQRLVRALVEAAKSRPDPAQEPA